MYYTLKLFFYYEKCFVNKIPIELQIQKKVSVDFSFE